MLYTVVCDLHKTVEANSIQLSRFATLADVLFSLLSLSHIGVSFKTIVKFFRIFCFKYVAVAAHQRMIMLDEWDEDNELALLEPVIERVGSTSTSFAYSREASGNVALRKMKRASHFTTHFLNCCEKVK